MITGYGAKPGRGNPVDAVLEKPFDLRVCAPPWPSSFEQSLFLIDGGGLGILCQLERGCSSIG